MVDIIEMIKEVFPIFFNVSKYALIIILVSIGLLTIKKYRGFFRLYKFKEYKTNNGKEEDFKEIIKETNVILGIFYIALAMGLLIGWIPRLLVKLSALFPYLIQKGVIYYIFEWINCELLNKLGFSIQDFEEILNYLMAGLSFWGFLSIILGMRFVIAYGHKTHTTSFKLFLGGIIYCVFTGFFTFIPFFI